VHSCLSVLLSLSHICLLYICTVLFEQINDDDDDDDDDVKIAYIIIAPYLVSHWKETYSRLLENSEGFIQ